MKVCQLCAIDFTLKNFLLPLIDGMRGTGWDVTAVCSDGPFVRDLRAAGYHIETVRIGRTMNPFAVLDSIVRLRQLFRRERFDVLHVHTPVAAMIGRVAARIAGIPLVVYTAHGFYFHDQMPRWKRFVFVAIERLGGLFTDLLFSQSSEDAEAAVLERICPRDRVLAIGNGVDKSRFDPAKVGDGCVEREALGIPADAFVVGLIGRLVREKGIAEFLEAGTNLAGRFPNLYFLIVGERLPSDHAGGIEKEYVQAKAVLGKRLVTTGLRSDVPQMLAVMNLFCLPSWREGMPRTIIEAMMMAKPVLATNIRGAREEVVPEVTGLLVPARAPDHLQDAIERFVQNPAWGEHLGQAGRQRALMLYDEEKIIALQLKHIDQAARNRALL